MIYASDKDGNRLREGIDYIVDGTTVTPLSNKVASITAIRDEPEPNRATRRHGIQLMPNRNGCKTRGTL